MGGGGVTLLISSPDNQKTRNSGDNIILYYLLHFYMIFAKNKPHYEETVRGTTPIRVRRQI